MQFLVFLQSCHEALCYSTSIPGLDLIVPLTLGRNKLNLSYICLARSRPTIHVSNHNNSSIFFLKKGKTDADLSLFLGFFFLMLKKLSIYFGYAGLFASGSKQGMLSSCSAGASLCVGFPCCRACALGQVGSVVTVSRL